MEGVGAVCLLLGLISELPWVEIWSGFGGDFGRKKRVVGGLIWVENGAVLVGFGGVFGCWFGAKNGDVGVLFPTG